jgi:hypothetical protein
MKLLTWVWNFLLGKFSEKVTSDLPVVHSTSCTTGFLSWLFSVLTFSIGGRQKWMTENCLPAKFLISIFSHFLQPPTSIPGKSMINSENRNGTRNKKKSEFLKWRHRSPFCYFRDFTTFFKPRKNKSRRLLWNWGKHFCKVNWKNNEKNIF